MNTHTSKPLSLSWWILIFFSATALLGAAFLSFHKSERRIYRKEPPLAEISEFSLNTQDGKIFSKSDLLGQIWVMDFIFTRCAGPCPLLTSRMIELSSKLSKNHEVKLASVTVDPSYDTPEILSSYAANIHADPRQWIFLTGSPHHITHFVKEVMMQPLAAESDGMPTHSTRLMIIDKNAMIRGYLDGNDPEVTQKILMKIGNLMRESS